jgi:hypothetical protein
MVEIPPKGVRRFLGAPILTNPEGSPGFQNAESGPAGPLSVRVVSGGSGEPPPLFCAA